jgi:hypothetical protein
MAKPKVQIDSYNIPYVVGDIVAFKRKPNWTHDGVYRSGSGKARLEIGKVVRLTPKTCAVRYITYKERVPVRDKHGNYLTGDDGKQLYQEVPEDQRWGISAREYVVRDSESILKLSMHSVPPHLFSMLDELEIPTNGK